MRIISGIAKGRFLKTPSGRNTRPMMDKVKESLFSTIQAYIDKSYVLDLYAGTGALGIEALSRGASHCDFNDKARNCIDIISENLKRTGFIKQSCISMKEDKKLLLSTHTMYDIIFFCPPYNLFSLEILEIALTKLTPEGILIAEHDKTTQLPKSLIQRELWKSKSFGQTLLAYYV